MDYDILITKFEEYCIPRKKLALLRYKFLTSRQNEAETFDNFVNKLKTLSHECELKELRNIFIKDMIIIGTNELRLQEKLLSETDITLEMAIKAGQTAEATRWQGGLLQREPKEVNFPKGEKKIINPTSRQGKAWKNSLFQKAELLSPAEKK